VNGDNGYPLLHMADYAKGQMYVLTVPDNPADLYKLPEAALRNIRQAVMREWEYRMDAPAKVAMFSYDNGVFIVESFRDQAVEIAIIADAKFKGLRDATTGQQVSGGEVIEKPLRYQRNPDVGKRMFTVKLAAHSWRVFEIT
jgi:hypothetical protein